MFSRTGFHRNLRLFISLRQRLPPLIFSRLHSPSPLMMAHMDKLVLVSGASGYIGSHAVKTLLEAGYRVRGTVRSVKNEKKIQPLKELCPEAAQNLEFVEADLTSEDSWPSAVHGCDYVLHIASPFVTSVKREEELIKPAVEGTLSVLKAVAATKGAVKLVVLTSSLACVFYGAESGQGRVYTEEDWSTLDNPGVDAYVKSKILAEQAAWEFVKNLPDEEKFDMTVVCPGFVLGPLLTNMEGESVQIMKRMLSGLLQMPMAPPVMMPIVDVRDVARAHMVAMTTPQVANQRVALAADTHWFKELAQTLSTEFSSKGYRIGTHEAPYALLWLYSWFDKAAALVLPRVGISFKIDNSKLKKDLGIQPIPMEKSVVEMAYSLIAKGIVPRKF